MPKKSAKKYVVAFVYRESDANDWQLYGDHDERENALRDYARATAHPEKYRQVAIFLNNPADGSRIDNEWWQARKLYYADFIDHTQEPLNLRAALGGLINSRESDWF